MIVIYKVSEEWIIQIPPMRQVDWKHARVNEEKVNLFANHSELYQDCEESTQVR